MAITLDHHRMTANRLVQVTSMLIPQNTYDAIIGQAVGEMIGRCGFISPSTLATALHKKKLPTPSLPSTKNQTIGLHGSHTQLSLAFSLTYQKLTPPRNSHSYVQALSDSVLPLLPFVRGSAFHLPDALKDEQLPYEPNLAPAIWMGPVSTMFPSFEKLLPWSISLAEKLSIHPISIVGAGFYSAICWGFSRKKPLQVILEQISNWRKKRDLGPSPVPDKIWWVFEQAFWIRKNYGLSPMLEFVSQTMELPKKLNTPTPYNILSFLPDVIYNVYASDDFTTAIIPISENTTPEFCSMCGTLASLQGKQPENWMKDHLPEQLGYKQINQWSYKIEEALNQQCKSANNKAFKKN